MRSSWLCLGCACDSDSSLSLKIFFSLVSEQHLVVFFFSTLCSLLSTTISAFSTSPALLLFVLLSPTALMTSQTRPHSHFLSSFFLHSSFSLSLTPILSLSLSTPSSLCTTLFYSSLLIIRINALTNQSSQNVPTVSKYSFSHARASSLSLFLSLSLLISGIPLAGTT